MDAIEGTRASLDSVAAAPLGCVVQPTAPGPRAWTACHGTERREIKSGTSDPVRWTDAADVKGTSLPPARHGPRFYRQLSLISGKGAP